MSTLAFWIPLLPILSAAALAAVSLFNRGRSLVRPIAVIPNALAIVLTLVVLVMHGSGGVKESMIRYAPTGGAELFLGARVDGLAALIAVLVTVVATAVQVYSISSMKDEPRYTSYTALISLFTGAMLAVVYSADLIVLLIGWEVMGACSYFLIGHYWERKEARSASLKAFLVTKTGDVPFLLGILLLGRGTGSFRIGAVVDHALFAGAGYTTPAAVLILGGVIGKSAQFPLQTWLPDAMAGPTPISALIHAATMVAAGIYVVARLYPVFLMTPIALWILGIVACVTMFGAAVAAFAQTDLKRILAYSTISQLAFMAAALAVGGRGAATFHLVTHGGFKALLFLAAGVVIHQAHTGDVNELRTHMLRRKLPITFIATTIGLAALAGIPPLSGFFSKESILGAAYETATNHAAKSLLNAAPSGLGWLVFIVGLVTAGVTAAYCLRTWLLLFTPPVGGWFRTSPEIPPRAEGEPEAPWTELGPLIGLSIVTVLLGVVGLNKGWFTSWLGDASGDSYSTALAAKGQLYQPADSYGLAPGLTTSILAILALAAGLGVVYLVWRAKPAEDPARLLGPVRKTALNGFYADKAQNTVVVKPTEKAADLVTFLDVNIVDGYVRGAGLGARALGGGLRRLQTGNVQLYLTGVLTGAIVIAAALGFGR